MVKFADMVRLALPIPAEQREAVENIRNVLDVDQFKATISLIKRKKAMIRPAAFDVSEHLVEQDPYPQLAALYEGDKHSDNEIKSINKTIESDAKTKLFETFAKEAIHHIPDLIAPNLIGMEDIKLASAIQLFAVDPFHILLLGDPGTGKTEVLRSSEEFAPISAFGLGSGTSGVGLTVAKSGGKLVEGLLPKANKGLCLIDELNLMKSEDRAGLYNAMEKGFVSYQKGGEQVKFDSKVRVLATANPKGDKFRGQTITLLLQQQPFDAALLSRFHLVFVVRKPSKDGLKEITKSIIENKKKVSIPKNDAEFIRDYIRYTWDTQVIFPVKFEPKVSKFVQKLQESEGDYLVEIGPRTVVGLMRICQARARMRGKDRVEDEDLEAGIDLFQHALTIK